MAAANNSISVIEATPGICSVLGKLKRDQPFGNEASSTKSKGMNGGISFNTDNGENAVITGPFDVRLTYLEEDDGQGNMEMVPYVQIFDSSLQNAIYAGYVYYQNQILNVMPGVLAPSQGWLYLDIDLTSNTYTYNIGAYVPTYPLAAKHWCYALAYITVSNNVYSIRRVHVPGNIVMPTLDVIQGAFDVTIDYPYADNLPRVYVYDSSNPSSLIAGYVYSGTTRYELERTHLTPMIGVVYVDINYVHSNPHPFGTQTIEIAAQLPTLENTDRRWVYALATITQENGVYIIHRMNMPGNLSVTGRWV